MYNMKHKFKEVTMSVGLEALKIFKAKGSVKMREKYPSIYREDIDKNCHFNPNDDYLYAPSSEELKNINNQTSPWYGFTLIPNVVNYYKWMPYRSQHYYIKPPFKIDPQRLPWRRSLYATLYLLNFLNWAIYYYNRVAEEYNNIPKGRPKKEDKVEAQEWTNIYAEMITALTDRVYTEEEIVEKANLAFKRNRFPLKPPYFLKLCRFFARAWYEERFCSPDKAVGSVEFAHYISNYIEASLHDDTHSCKRYSGNDDNHKKEVARLFAEKEKIEYKYHNFHILLEKHDNTQAHKDSSYTISISQYGYRHTFYLFSRLYQYRYASTI